jgi:flagellar export protein FliJ
MPFHFSLDALLRLRATQTRQEEVQLESLSHRLVATRHQKTQLKRRQRAYQTAMVNDLRQGAEASELHLRLVGQRGLVEAERRLDQAILELQRAWQEQEKKYLAARQREEVLKSVRDGQLAAYREEERRREQQLVDDLFLSRRGQDKLLPGAG